MNRRPAVFPIVPLATSDAPLIVRRKGAIPAMVSTCIHASVLLLLALWVLPSLAGRDQVVLEMAFGGGEPVTLSTFEITPFELPSDSSEEPPTELAEIFPPIEIGFTVDPLITPVQPTVQPVAMLSVESNQFTAESLSSSATVEGAVDQITGQLKSKLQNGDLLVVWLLDSSHSLLDDRQRVAARLTPFYKELVDEKSSYAHTLRSTVVSFGSRMRERVPPTTFGNKIVAAVEKLPIDRTGDEKVFDAVSQCAEHYRRNWDKQIQIVIWTDESGDDVSELSESITVCRQHNVTVSVVGPSSVLGADTGLHSYTDPKSGGVYQLPVKRGPDSAMSERIELGYWYPTRFNGFGRGLPSWLGGQDLQGILSGFSPYALTRLSMQTGGTYTIFDRPEDRGPFDPVTMREYAPSYASLDEYQADIQAHPIRRAVMLAVGELKGKKIDEPTRMLFIKKTGERPFDFMRFFYSPAEFKAKLRKSRGRFKAQATRSAFIVEAALRHLSTDETLENGLEDDYRYEKSPRWRAWYDLTRGRLLATSVRLEEYRMTLDKIIEPGELLPSTNHAILIADQRTQAGETHQKRALEAERLLRRCVTENRRTPWETLAQRELDFATGVAVQQRALTPSPGPAVRQPNLPRF